jgi:YVTN family beta-propeller protein
VKHHLARAVIGMLGLLFALPSVQGATAPIRKLYVDNTDGDTVSVVDLASRKVSHEIHVGRHPHGLGVSPDRRRLYVSVEDTHQIVVIDTATDAIIRSIPTTGRPNQLAVTPDGRFLYVAIADRSVADVIDTRAGRVVKSLEVGRFPHNCYCPPDGKHIYVTSVNDRRVREFDFRNGHRLVQTVTFDGDVRPLCVTRDEKRLFVALAGLHGFAWADLTSGHEVERVVRPLPPLERRSKFAYLDTHGLELTPDNRELWVTSFIGNGLMVFDVTGSQPVYETTVDVGDGPNWLAFSADGRYAYSANAGANSISIVDTAARRAVAEVKVGAVPKRLLEVDVPAKRADRRPEEAARAAR